MVLAALLVYNLLFPFIFLLYFPFYLRKLVKRGNFITGFGERFGWYSSSKRKHLARVKAPVWIHAVSVGEVTTALSFIHEWKRAQPDLHFVLSTTTSTGQKIARERAGDHVVAIYYPLDFILCVRQALSTIKPRALLFFEVEIWPTMIVAAAQRNIPLALINGRMSERSIRGYRRQRWFFQGIFSRFSLFCMQTMADAAHIRSLLKDQLSTAVHVCSTMKFDQHSAASSQVAIATIINAVYPEKNRVLMVAASTHPGEEKLVARTYRALTTAIPHLGLLLIPRHVERAPEIMEMLTEEGLESRRLTELRAHPDHNGNPKSNANQQNSPGINPILIVDTTGEMLAFLTVADLVVMGNSFAGHRGGHNIIEPALLGKPVIFGAGMDNFQEVARIFKADQAAVEVHDDSELETTLLNLLHNPEERERLGNAARQTVENNRGAIAKSIALLNTIIDQPSTR